MTSWKPYLIALGVGFIVGIERESSQTNKKALGVRTFLLLSLLGAVAGDLPNNGVAVLVSVFALGLILISYVIQIFDKLDSVHLGLTTEIAAGLVYVAGFSVHTYPVLTATIGPIVALILFSKIPIHRFTHELKPLELRATITILLLTAVTLDFAPDMIVDPWGLFNPRKFGYIVLTLATLEFSSYILLKFIGEKKGTILVGFFGGLVSSTAVLISSSKKNAKLPTLWRASICAVLASQIASFTELLIIIFLISKPLFISVLPSLFVGMAFTAIWLWILALKQDPPTTDLVLKSPLDWKGVFRLSFIFTFFLLMVAAAQHWIGQSGIFVMTFLTGLFELQGISLANSTLFSQGQLSLVVASRCILLAVMASIISKICLSWFFTRNAFSIFLTLIFIPVIALIYLMARLQNLI